MKSEKGFWLILWETLEGEENHEDFAFKCDVILWEIFVSTYGIWFES